MLNKLRNFSKGKLAIVLVAIIIIPFVFWGMGSVFSGGSTNSIAKINNNNVSTKDFVEFVNNSKLNNEFIKQNIDNNILEELLTQLVSTSLIDMEIENLNIYINDEILAKKIKKQKSFLDENNTFSRVKYEKFLLENNMSAINFEQGIKKNELKKKLFIYISGGIKSPYFLVNKTFKDQAKSIEVDYINLNEVYYDKKQISNKDVENYINENSENYLQEKINVSYVKITPESLFQEKEFSDEFFLKIDEIENLILNNNKIRDISIKYNLKINKIDDYNLQNSLPNTLDNDLLSEIFTKRNQNKIQIIDKNDFFLLYEITNSKKSIPNLNDKKFIEKVKNDIFEKKKYDFNKDLLTRIQNKNFSNDDFLKLSNDQIQNLIIKSIEEKNIFTKESNNILYSLPKNSFSLVADESNNVYLIKIKNIKENDLDKNNKKINFFTKQSNMNLRDNLYSSYDYLLNEKYKIKINQKTLERMKNYFK